jgi:ABC-type transporter MlaC component
MSDESETDLAHLREATDHGDRLEKATEEVDRAELQESVTEYLVEIEDGDRQKTVSVWDGEIAALLSALEDHPEEMTRVGNALRETLDSDTDTNDDVGRSEIIRLALRVGLREATPEDIETVRKAVRDYATRRL